MPSVAISRRSLHYPEGGREYDKKAFRYRRCKIRGFHYFCSRKIKSHDRYAWDIILHIRQNRHEREVVDRGWIGKEDFLDLFAVTQSLPGIFAVNISIFVGYRLRGVWGSVICALGTILPSFCIILLIALFFNHFQDNPWVVKVFNGIRPAVVALIAVPCISAARSLHLKQVQLIAPAIGALLIWLCGVSPVWIILAGIAGGLAYTFWIKGKWERRQR